MKYNMTYFIYPYIIEKEKWRNYILNLINNSKVILDNWRKDKDIDTYNFFTSEVRKYIFNDFENLDNDILSCESVKFRYKLEEDAQGKIGEENGIFFKIQTIHIVCFKSGICFLIFKTNVENGKSFANLLNFNYKFRDINSDYNVLKEYENIKIQTDAFENIENLKSFINKITLEETKIDTNRFYTYSYACIENDAWETGNFTGDMEKYINILPSGYNVNSMINTTSIIEKTKYSKFGINKYGVTLICSDADTKNYLNLVSKFENEYLNLYIISLYEKFYSKMIIKEYNLKKIVSLDEYFKLKNNLLKDNITNSEFGEKLYKEFQKVQNIDEITEEMNKLIDLEYKKTDIEKSKRENKIVLGILAISMLINIINFIALIYRN